MFREREVGEVFRQPRLLSEVRPPELVIHRPMLVDKPESFYTENHRMDAEAGIGMLCWHLSYQDSGSFSPLLRGVALAFDAYVDAQTGRLVRINEYRPLAVAGGGGRAAGMPFLWDLPEGEVAIFGDFGKVSVRSASVAAAGVAPSEEAPMPLALQFGKILVPARFDRDTGTLRTYLGGRVSVGKPSAALLEALRGLSR
jgi:hypothetical protein